MGAALTPRGRRPAGRPVQRGAPSPKAPAGRAAPQGAFQQVTSDRNRRVSPRANIAAPAARASSELGTPKPTAAVRESRPNGGSEFKPEPVSEHPAIAGGAAATCWAPFRPCPGAARRYSPQRRAAPACAPVRALPAAARRPGPLAARASNAAARPGGTKNPALPASPGPAAPGRPPPTKGRGLSRRLRPARVGPLGGARSISARGCPAAAARATGGERPRRGVPSRPRARSARPGRGIALSAQRGPVPTRLRAPAGLPAPQDGRTEPYSRRDAAAAREAAVRRRRQRGRPQLRTAPRINAATLRRRDEPYLAGRGSGRHFVSFFPPKQGDRACKYQERGEGIPAASRASRSRPNKHPTGREEEEEEEEERGGRRGKGRGKREKEGRGKRAEPQLWEKCRLFPARAGAAKSDGRCPIRDPRAPLRSPHGAACRAAPDAPECGATHPAVRGSAPPRPYPRPAAGPGFPRAAAPAWPASPRLPAPPPPAVAERRKNGRRARPPPGSPRAVVGAAGDGGGGRAAAVWHSLWERGGRFETPERSWRGGGRRDEQRRRSGEPGAGPPTPLPHSLSGRRALPLPPLSAGRAAALRLRVSFCR